MDTIETFKPVYQRFLESGMTVCDFCKSSNLLESRFYYYPLLDGCLLYTSDAADEEDSVDLGGRRIIKKKENKTKEEK